MNDRDPTWIILFLRRAGHRVDGYIAQDIGIHPGTCSHITYNIIFYNDQYKLILTYRWWIP